MHDMNELPPVGPLKAGIRVRIRDFDNAGDPVKYDGRLGVIKGMRLGFYEVQLDIRPEDFSCLFERAELELL